VHFIFLLTFLTLGAWATTFNLQPIEKQLLEADGIVIGHYLESKSVKLESGELATQMIFKVQSEWGMQSDLFGLEEVIVHYPGGKLEGLHVQIQGVPEFVVGEKVAIFTKNLENRFWGLNLGFGTYKVVNFGNETILVNTLFPEDPKVGQVPIEKFETLVREIKGSDLKIVRTHLPEEQPTESRTPASLNEGQKRSIASEIDQVDNREVQSDLSVFWLVAILAFAGGMFRLVRARDV
jgi:hypothetical protein